eukprot:scaffold1052_cov50-Attheya_sp.AAC.5
MDMAPNPKKVDIPTLLVFIGPHLIGRSDGIVSYCSLDVLLTTSAATHPHPHLNLAYCSDGRHVRIVPSIYRDMIVASN